MGATPAKMFPQPGSYAMDNENIVQPQDPTPIIPQQQFVSMNSYSGTGTAAPATPANNGRFNGRGRGKFYSDRELDGPPGFGNGGGPGKPIFPPPVKKPHLPPNGNPLAAYNINSDY